MQNELNLAYPANSHDGLTAGNLDPESRRPWYFNPYLLLAPLLIQLVPWWQPTEDATGYLSLAHTISHGGPLRMLSSPVLHYAIGYPLLITPAFFVWKLPLYPVIALNFLFAIVTAYGIYVWSKRYSPASAWFITVLTLWNASYWELYRHPLSETAFLAFLIWGVLACRRLLEVQETRQIVIMTLIASVLVIAVSTIRQIGIFLAAGYGMAAIFKALRRESTWLRTILTTLAVGVPASVILVGLLMMYRSMAQGQENSHTYLDLIDDSQMTFVQQLIESVRLRTAETGRLLIPGFYKVYSDTGQWLTIPTAIYLVLSAAVLYGWWKLARKDGDVLIMTAPFYLAVYLLWPFDQGTRFMAPMLPVLWLCLWRFAESRIATPNQIFAWLIMAHLLQSCVYFGSYVATARKCSADFQSLTKLIPAITDDSTTVCGVGVSRSTNISANLLIDRIIPAFDTGSDVPEGMKWVITDKPEALIPGFDKQGEAGRITLFSRRDQTLSQR